VDGETEGTGEAQALTFGFSFPTLLGLLPTVVLIIALVTVGKESPGLSSTTSFPGDVYPTLSSPWNIAWELIASVRRLTHLSQG